MPIAVNNFAATRHDLDLFRNENPWTHTFHGKDRWGNYGDFTDSYSARMQFRLYEGAEGPALLALNGSGASRVEPAGRWSCSAVIQQSDLMALPRPAEIGDVMLLRYDLLISTAAGESVSHYGIATIRAGVTR